LNKLSCTAGSGWLFDLYAENNGMRLWFITEDGKHISLWEPYDPLFYVRTRHSFLDSLLKSKPLNSIPLTITRVERMELQSGENTPVLEVKVKALSRYTEELYAVKMQPFLQAGGISISGIHLLSMRAGLMD